MVKLIRDRAAAGNEPFVDFSVYLSTKDKKTVLGYANFDYQSGEKSVTFLKTPYGIPVREALITAREYADKNAIPFLLINDPNGLFNDTDG